MNPMDQVRRARQLIDTGAGVGITVEKMLKRGDAESVMAGILTTILFNPDEDEVEKAYDVLDDAVADYHDETVAKVRADHAEDKARRRRKDQAEAQRRAAEQRGTNKRKGTKEMAEIENPVAFAKAVLNNGHNPNMTKRDMYIDIAKRAEAQRLKGETEAQAFARYITKEPDGIALFSVHKILPGPDYEFERPEVTKADTPPMPALDKLKAMAADHQKTTGVTPEAAFAAVYTDPANKDVVAQHKAELAEQSAIDAAGKWPGVAQTFRPAGAPEHTARVS